MKKLILKTTGGRKCPMLNCLYKEVKTLPYNRIEEVLYFVEFIKQKEGQNAGDSWFEKGEVCPICLAKSLNTQ